MEGRSPLRPSEMENSPQNEDISDAMLMNMLNASIERMDQESAAITASSSTHNYQSVGNMEVERTDEESEGITASSPTHNYQSGGTMERFPSSDAKIHSAEAEGVTEEEIQHEPKKIPKKSPKNNPGAAGFRWKSIPSAKGFRGEIRQIEDGNIEWKDGNTWVPAVYHDTIRAKLIEQAGQLGSYDHGRKYGLDPLDVTSFHPDQKTWGPDRNEHWPLMPDQLLFRLERQDYPVPDYEVTPWIDDGRIVLDIDNLPVKTYRNIPSTVSSEIEAYLIEMMGRMDTRITHRDIRARMPHTTQTRTGTKRIVSLSTIDERLRRFRLENACPSWYERQSSAGLKAFVMNLLSEEGLKRNSTQELSGLTKPQQGMVKKGRKRESLPRSNSKKPSPENSAQREEAGEGRSAPFQAAEEDENEDLHRGQKRKREDEPLSVPEDEPLSVLDDEPLSVPDDEPLSMLDDEPLSVLDDGFLSVLDDEPLSVLDPGFLSVLDDEPLSVLDDEPLSVLDDEPSSVPDDEPLSVLDDEPLSVPDDEPPTFNPRITFALTMPVGRGRSMIQPSSSSDMWDGATLVPDQSSQRGSSPHDSPPAEEMFGNDEQQVILDNANVAARGRYSWPDSRRAEDMFGYDELDVTLADYKRWMGHWPPPTLPEDDFDTQYNDLQLDFNARWKGEGPAPQLMHSRTWDPTLDYGSYELRLIQNRDRN